MAYARFSRHSDVYVYESDGAWVCCRCSLSGGETIEIVSTAFRSKMIAHLRQHEAKGDKVPQDAIEELQNEITNLGDSTASS